MERCIRFCWRDCDKPEKALRLDKRDPYYSMNDCKRYFMKRENARFESMGARLKEMGKAREILRDKWREGKLDEKEFNIESM